MKEILKYMPIDMKNAVGKYVNRDGINEIRLRINNFVILKFASCEIITDYMVKKEDMLNIMLSISKNSIYSIQNDINNGFLTIKGGHRIGITGEVVLENRCCKEHKKYIVYEYSYSKRNKRCCEQTYKTRSY